MRRFGKWIGTWVAVSLLLVTGCSKGAADLANGSQTASKVHSDAEAASEMEILEEVENAGIDNTLDKYTAIAKHSLRIAADDKANGEISVSLNANAIGFSQGVHLGKHLYESSKENWDEICFARNSGEEIRKRLEYPDGEKCIHGTSDPSGDRTTCSCSLRKRQMTDDGSCCFWKRTIACRSRERRMRHVSSMKRTGLKCLIGVKKTQTD